MRKSVIISIVYPPTTPAFSHPSFPKEENGDTTDYKLSSHYFTNSPYNQIFSLFLCFFVSFFCFKTKERKL